MRIGITRRAGKNSNQHFEGRSVNAMSVHPVEGLDDGSPIQVHVLKEMKKLDVFSKTCAYMVLTKLTRARTNAPTSQITFPSAAKRAKVDISSTTCVSRGGLVEVM